MGASSCHYKYKLTQDNNASLATYFTDILTFYRSYTNVGNSSINSTFIGNSDDGTEYTFNLASLSTYYYTPLTNMCLGLLEDSTCVTANVPDLIEIQDYTYAGIVYLVITCQYVYVCTTVSNFPGAILFPIKTA